jgi:hypothetical protein
MEPTFSFDFRRASPTGAEQKTSGRDWKDLKPINNEKGDVELSDKKTTDFSTKCAVVCSSFSGNIPSS